MHVLVRHVNEEPDLAEAAGGGEGAPFADEAREVGAPHTFLEVAREMMGRAFTKKRGEWHRLRPWRVGLV